MASSEESDIIFGIAVWGGMAIAVLSFALLFLLSPPQVDILLGAMGTVGALASILGILLGATRRTIRATRSAIVEQLRATEKALVSRMDSMEGILREIRELLARQR